MFLNKLQQTNFVFLYEVTYLTTLNDINILINLLVLSDCKKKTSALKTITMT